MSRLPSALPSPLLRSKPRAEVIQTVSDVLIETLRGVGMRHAYGVIGGAVVPFYDALSRAPVSLVNCRHESGAAFAAVEASLAADSPALVFTTTGPGLTNALTGAVTGRWEGAKLLLISGHTPARHRGGYALQESNSHQLAGGLYAPRGLFDYATALEDPAELPRVLRTLIRGFANPRGFVAHIAMPLDVQAARGPVGFVETIPAMEVAASAGTIAEATHRLADRFAIWVGWGARHASKRVRELVARTGAPVICTPRGKGVIPEDDPHFLGVSGAVGGHTDLAQRLAACEVERILVLGTRLGELSSAYDTRLVPPGGFIHVDIDPEVPGAAFPEVETLMIQAEIDGFLGAILERLPRRRGAKATSVFELLAAPDWSGRAGASLGVEAPEASGKVGVGGQAERPLMAVAPRRAPALILPRTEPLVRPQYLMQCLQSRVVEGSKSVVLSESGNSFAWTANLLRFSEPKRYRQSGLFCPMGHVSAGVLGTAAATGLRAVAVVGDGAFLMQNEISTAARVQANVTWIVLNDARYGMVDQGLRALGYPEADMHFPTVDFVAMARSVGAEGMCVSNEEGVLDALEWGMTGRGPFVLDIRIDPSELAPFGGRVRSIDTQTTGDV